MDQGLFPTKGNLMLAKSRLSISKQGYELLDKKRNVLIREIMALNQQATSIQNNIDNAFKEAYMALQNANINLGINNVEYFSYAIPEEKDVKISLRSIMGVLIPLVQYDQKEDKDNLNFSFENTSSALDIAYVKFNAVKKLVIRLSMIENSAYRLAINIKKTQKRTNALKNIIIPKYEKLVKNITEVLEERERDEFTRLKIIKEAYK